MKTKRLRLLAALAVAGLGLAAGSFAAEAPAAHVAPKPLYRDPVYDGAADPVVVWNPSAKAWWMFYTNRRANVPGLSGVAWVHGTKVGIAESADGATWRHLGDADITLPEAVGGTEPTLWAPEVVTAPDGTHHMFLSVVPGIFENWQHPRTIVHLTSADLRKWTYVSALKLSSDRVIDACVSALPGGGWRMWYNNERDGKSMYYADSRDLATWTDRGKVTSMKARGEGPYVFTWRGYHWMLVDTWKGLGVYRSLDMDTWQQQSTLLLDKPGKGADDGVNGGHPGVVVNDGRAYCFYFTHPGRAGTISPQDKDALALRRSSIQVVELFEKDGWLACDRDAPTAIALQAPGVRGGGGQFNPNAPLTARDPEDAAILRADGNLDIRVHDPSTLAFSNGEWWMFYTGRGLGSWHSKDLKTWEAGPRVFEAAPAWVADAVPENRNANFWAPDVMKLGDRYLLYYSVSTFGKRVSAIALATNATLDPHDPKFKWTDEGIVVRSGQADNFNAIDPAIFHDTDGKLWLVFGSYWSGIQLVELDPSTGRRLAPDVAPVNLAHDRAIEASFLYRHDNHYYLFVNHGLCCRGVNSTYNIVVGRSDRIAGPYLDRDGKPLLEGGGTLVLGSDGPFVGPGHAGIVTVDGHEVFGCHFYDATQRGRSAYALRPLSWDAAGWPVVGKVETGATTSLAPAQALPNPLIRERADPQILRHTDGWYYFMGTVPEYDRLELRRAQTIEGLAMAEPKTIWRKHDTGAMGSHIWAPEIHGIDGKWYVYFAAGGAEKVWDIRIYVLENASANPLEGEWVERGQLKTNWESFALDATTFVHRGVRYLAWAQKDPKIRGNTNLYLAKMDSPTSITGAQVMISKPDLPWEQIRYWVNEGPAFLERNGKVFITYSAAGTGKEYCLGLLTADADADLLDPKSWTKSPQPVFATSEANGIFGPGHNSFTTSADGRTDLLVYHARNYAEIKGDPLHDPNRHTRVQAFTWRADGTPDFGVPAPETK